MILQWKNWIERIWRTTAYKHIRPTNETFLDAKKWNHSDNKQVMGIGITNDLDIDVQNLNI